MFCLKRLTCFLLVIFPIIVFAQDNNDKPQEVISSIQTQILHAIENKDLEKLSQIFTPNACIVLENAQPFHSNIDFKKYIESPALLNQLKVKSFKVKKVSVDNDIEVIEKNIFIASGTAEFEYQFSRDKVILEPVQWIATFIQREGKWYIASYQSTVNVLDNPIIVEMRHDYYMISFITLIIGFIIGIAWKKIFRKFKM